MLLHAYEMLKWIKQRIGEISFAPFVRMHFEIGCLVDAAHTMIMMLISWNIWSFNLILQKYFIQIKLNWQMINASNFNLNAASVEFLLKPLLKLILYYALIIFDVLFGSNDTMRNLNSLHSIVCQMEWNSMNGSCFWFR